jgi:hypothetical protein
MNKNQKTNESQGGNAQLEELLEKGTVTLTGKSRADVYTQAADLMDALPIDATWSRGIVNYDPANKTFTQVIIIKK